MEPSKEVKKIDKNLSYHSTLWPSSLRVYRVLDKGGIDYVLKIGSARYEWEQEHVLREKKALEIAEEVEGITHLVRYYGKKGKNIAILKEYFDGECLTFAKCHKGACIQIRSTVNELHDIGLADFEIVDRNVVVSPDGFSARMVDLGICQFRYELKQEQFESLKTEDMDILNSMLLTFGFKKPYF